MNLRVPNAVPEPRQQEMQSDRATRCELGCMNPEVFNYEGGRYCLHCWECGTGLSLIEKKDQQQH